MKCIANCDRQGDLISVNGGHVFALCIIHAKALARAGADVRHYVSDARPLYLNSAEWPSAAESAP